MNFRLTEDQARFWQTLFAGVTALALVAGGIYTLVQYFNTREADQRNFTLQLNLAQLQASNAKMEAKKPFFAKQLELCEQASSAAAILVSPKNRDTAERKKANGEFWRLYWGPLAIVEDRAVETAMVRFGHCLEGECADQSIENLSLDLAHRCRDLISESWKLDLPTLRYSLKKTSERAPTAPEGPP